MRCLRLDPPQSVITLSMMIPNLLVFLTSIHGRLEWSLDMVRSTIGLYTQLFLFLLLPWMVVDNYHKTADSLVTSSDNKQYKEYYDDVEVIHYDTSGNLSFRLNSSRLVTLARGQFSAKAPVVFTGSSSASGSDSRSSGNLSMRISADSALFVNDQIKFYDHVIMHLDRCGASESSICNNPLTIQSSQLDYDVKKQFFVAIGDTVMQQGLQSISARRISGNISDQDFSFDQAVITSRKPPRDTA